MPDPVPGEGRDAALNAAYFVRYGVPGPYADKAIISEGQAADFFFNAGYEAAEARVERAEKALREPKPQRQDSLTDQLRDVLAEATRMGCLDAADWIRRTAATDHEYGL